MTEIAKVAAEQPMRVLFTSIHIKTYPAAAKLDRMPVRGQASVETVCQDPSGVSWLHFGTKTANACLPLIYVMIQEKLRLSNPKERILSCLDQHKIVMTRPDQYLNIYF